MKLQTGRSDGLTSGSNYSSDGGFGFTSYNPNAFVNASANAYRADFSLGLGDFAIEDKTALTYYTQHLDAGYSAPGFDSLTATDYPYGRHFQLWSAPAGACRRQGGQEGAGPGLGPRPRTDVAYKISKRLEREHRSAARRPRGQLCGRARDTAAGRANRCGGPARGMTPGFMAARTPSPGRRLEERRPGRRTCRCRRVVCSVTKAFHQAARRFEAGLGPGGKLGANYLVSDHTTLCLNYSLDNERADGGVFSARDAGFEDEQRLSDSSTVYVEERYQDIDSATGLTHATGVTLTLTIALDIGANAEVGTLVDSQTVPRRSARRPASCRLRPRQDPGFEAESSIGTMRYSIPDTTFSNLKTWLRPGTISRDFGSHRTGGWSASSTTRRATKLHRDSSTTAATPRR